MYEFIYYRVKDVMTPDPVAIEADAALSDVEVIFEKHDFNGLPAVEKSRKLIGMVTKLDLLKAFTFTEKSKIPPYDAIMVTAAAPEVPLPLLDQLREGGRLIMPVGARIGQVLHLYQKHENQIKRDHLAPVAFVPLIGDHGWDSP